MNSNRAALRTRHSRHSRPANSLRIIAGAWRGRTIDFPDSLGLRPTPDRVRETLFNWLGQDLTGRRCLDLFAGSGALGLEALSRNAREVVFVEAAAPVAAAIRANALRLGAAESTWRVERTDALESLRAGHASQAGFDVVFLDPPFHMHWIERVLPLLQPHLAVGAMIYVESEAALRPAPGYAIHRSARAGAVHYGILIAASE